MKDIIIAILVFNYGITRCQNLVSNHSFEQFTSCPSQVGQTSKAFGWFDPNGSSSDYFNYCSSNTDVQVPTNLGGSQYASDGYGYIGLAVYLRHEYASSMLLDSLSAGVVYQVNFKVSAADYQRNGADAISALFSSSVPTCMPAGSCVINSIPQVSNPSGNVIVDTANWVLISGTFTAVGGEKYITLGSFVHDSLTNIQPYNQSSPANGAYYYIDEVVVIPDSLVTSKTPENSKGNFYVYPNPTTESLSFSGISPDNFVINDVTGRVVKMNSEVGASIEVVDLKPGMYFITVSCNGKGYIKSFIKQ